MNREFKHRLNGALDVLREKMRLLTPKSQRLFTPVFENRQYRWAIAMDSDGILAAERRIVAGEAKSRNHGLQDVREQAFRYVNELNLSVCRKVLLTDGGRFYLYARALSNVMWSEQAVGYLNVEKIRTNHIAPPGTNAVDTIVALTPAAASREIL